MTTWLQTNSEKISISAALIHRDEEQKAELRNWFRINLRQFLMHIIKYSKK